MSKTSVMRARTLARLIACVALGTGCAAPDGTERVTLRDSAGAVIVVSRRPAWDRSAPWRLSDVPLLEIGGSEAHPESGFQSIAGARRLAGGRIVVADGGASTVRMFGPDGAVRWTVGRAGDGPGEFRLIESLGVGPGDSIWVYDFGLRRFTILTFGGQVARTVSLGGALSAVGAVGRLSDGRFVVREFWSGATGGIALRSGLRRDPAAIALLGADGALVDTIAVVLGREVHIRDESGRAVMSAPLFARSASAAVLDDRIIAGDQERFELREYRADGTLGRIMRLPLADLAISRADVDRMIDEEVARRPAAEQPGFRRQLEAMDIPPTQPAFGDLLFDDRGDIWAAAYARWPQFPGEWTVLDPEGRWLGTVTMPEGFRPLSIGVDLVLGVWRDEMDVERIRLYRLIRP